MTAYEIFRSGTKNVGEYFKDMDNFGTIAVGNRADLLLVSTNPFQDVANIAKRSGVMVQGRWLPEQEIQQRLEKLAQSTAGPPRTLPAFAGAPQRPPPLRPLKD